MLTMAPHGLHLQVRYQSRQRASVSRPRQRGRFAAGGEEQPQGEDEDYMSEDEEVQGGDKDSQQP
jgi:hypothetical protein